MNYHNYKTRLYNSPLDNLLIKLGMTISPGVIRTMSVFQRGNIRRLQVGPVPRESGLESINKWAQWAIIFKAGGSQVGLIGERKLFYICRWGPIGNVMLIRTVLIAVGVVGPTSGTGL